MLKQRSIFLLICCLPLIPFAQNPKLIKVKKDQSTFFFFQKGSKSNLITPNKSDVFYLVLSDSLKQVLEIETENAQITAAENDSLVLIKYLPGINYLHKYIPQEKDNESNGVLSSKKQLPSHLQLQTLINGASSLEKNKISVVFKVKQSGNTFASFYYLSN